jgi:Protein of unknown function (DUF3102)
MSLKRGLEHAMAAGALLIEAKALLKHGQWLPWLRDHCAMSDRTARLYTRLAKNRAQIEGQIGNVADLSVRGAVALIAPPKQSELANFVPMVVDAALDDLELADVEQAKIEYDKRRAACAATDLALRRIRALAEKEAAMAAESAWCLLGEQLLSAIADYKNYLEEDSGIASSLHATAAILKARDIASEMLQRVPATTLVELLPE